MSWVILDKATLEPIMRSDDEAAIDKLKQKVSDIIVLTKAEYELMRDHAAAGFESGKMITVTSGRYAGHRWQSNKPVQVELKTAVFDASINYSMKQEQQK